MLKAVIEHFLNRLNVEPEKEKNIRHMLYCVAQDKRWQNTPDIFLADNENLDIPASLSAYQSLFFNDQYIAQNTLHQQMEGAKFRLYNQSWS